MFILSRYVSRLVAVTSLSGILIFVFILITGNAMRDILGLLADGTIPFSLFIELLWLLVPYAFSFAMPLGVLIGILLTMGRMSANQELTALKAAGISLTTLSGRTPCASLSPAPSSMTFPAMSFMSARRRRAG
jgi:lipopolysaccharide export system permease protein